MNYIFGTGPLGMAVLREFLNRGQKVKVINRSGKADIPQGVELIKGDARDRNFTKDICKDAEKFFHCAGLPYSEWSDHLPTMMNGLIEAAAFSGAKIIYADNLYAYGPATGEYHEDLSYKPIGVKTKVRAQVAETLLNSHQQGKIKAVIGRGPDFFRSKSFSGDIRKQGNWKSIIGEES
ncbi:NAD-dependent epimerase/dehydratase family protein [Bacillus methanolicus]|uniref:NAD-dependent epimerase/dehydratase family protein n=1 Tax=Bacillus methanolicus TaxID=1471 RepID=UPI000682A9FE|nr:NAD-dependent epimerase/dehydratase family protein [Bacillus methanolicus]